MGEEIDVDEEETYAGPYVGDRAAVWGDGEVLDTEDRDGETWALVRFSGQWTTWCPASRLRLGAAW